MSEVKKVKIVCSHCGSEEISRDAVVRWNKDTQDWEISATFDENNFCDDCDGEALLKEVELSPEEIKSSELAEISAIKQSIELLSKAGYCTDNLWCIDDVKNSHKCTDQQAIEVLRSALSNEATMDQIWFDIKCGLQALKLKK